MRRILQVFTAITISIVLCETVLRVYNLYKVNNIDMMNEPMSILDGSESVFFTEGYGIRKGNSAGALDLPLKGDRSIHGRALLFGDSYSEALQIRDEEVYDNIVEDLYKSRGITYEIVNYGRSGMSTFDELDLYIHFGKKLKHDRVLIQFSQNDFYDNYHSELKYESENGITNSDKWIKKGKELSVYYFLRNNSVFVNLLATRLYELKNTIMNFRENDVELNVKQNKPSIEEIENTRKILKWFFDETKINSAELIIFQIPNFETKSNNSHEINSICNEIGIKFIDVAVDMFAGDYDNIVFFNGFINTKYNSGHMNKNGHYVLGQALFNRLIGE